MKMSSIIAGMLLLSSCGTAFAVPYMEGSVGLANESYGVRGGSDGSWDLSLGYFNAREKETDLNTLSAEAYRCISAGAFTFKAGGGFGFTIPNINANGNGWDTADNDVSYILGGGTEYAVSKNWSIGLTLKGLFFTADVHRVVHGFHNETLYINGNPVGEVEVEDETHFNDRMNFDKAIVGLVAKYKF